MAKTYDRNTNLDNEEEKNTKTENFDDIIKKNVDDIQAMRILRDRLGDSKKAEKAFEAYKEKKNFIAKKANKLKALIFSKYSNLTLPALLEKARKYKKKYGFTDDEFHAFVNLAITDKSFASTNIYNQPTTPMGRTLGHSAEISHGKMNVLPNELDILQDILRMQVEYSLLAEQIKFQSLTYIDCAPQAITGEYDSRKHSSFSFIHPVIAALFFPRIKYLDEHMLLASIADIVFNRYKGIPIRTQPEYELYWDLITDPNEVVCVSPKESSLIDLRNRVRLQVELWKLVRELREGRYYCEDFRAFNVALDSCRTGWFDVPDMCNVRDEGTVLRKLFGAFALRPTIISISSITWDGRLGMLPNVMSCNYNMNSMALSQVTTIPTVNLRLPYNFKNKMLTVNLFEALEQPDWFVENKMIIPKIKNIIYSRDIIVFYAPRRYQTINYGRINAPYNFTVLPPTHSALETINDINISYNETIYIGDDTFHLRSVVFVERSMTNPCLIVGSSAGIIIRRDLFLGRAQSSYLLYNPQAAIIKFEDPTTGMFDKNPPIGEIPGVTPFVDGNAPESFRKRASTRGTIFVYVKNDPQQTAIC